jgi:hypothetical protein
MKYFLLFLTLALTSQLKAQDPPKKVRTDFMPVAIGGNITLYYRYKNKCEKLEAFESAMGTPIFYSGPQLLELYKTEKDLEASATANPTITPLLSIQLPENSQRTLLLFTSSADQKISAKAFAIDATNFAAGDYRVYNLSSLNAIGVIGKKKFNITPGKTIDVSQPDLREKDRDLGVQLGYVDEEKKEHLTYSSVWGHSSLARQYIFLLNSGNPQDPVQARKFHDVPSVPSRGYEPEKKAP